MIRRRDKRKIMALDLTPLIDVVFQLLIFFMISTTFNKFGAIDIHLPSSEIVVTPEKTSLEIVIDKNSRYYILIDNKNQEIALEDLDEILNGVKDVSISADKDLQYHIITDLIGRIKKHGVENLSLNLKE
jgi:biopolymer transport protein ExbD